MLLIDQGGTRTRKACDGCHRVRVQVGKSGKCKLCVSGAERKRHRAMAFYHRARQLQAALRSQVG